MADATQNVERRVERFGQVYAAVREQLGRVIVGHTQAIEQVLTGLLTGGHVLLEGVPGLGKTLLVRTLADSLDLAFSRIQFTPDLMPADITGTDMIAQTEAGQREFRFRPGPVFANIVLADEINRATPKTQSAVLEAMQERSVTVGRTTHRLAEPFFLLATQNPLELEGTYPLPEAQLDRFAYKVLVTAPSGEELVQIFSRTTVGTPPAAIKAADGATLLAMQQLVREAAVAAPVAQYVARLVRGTHADSESATPLVKKYVRYGASPRAGQSLLLGGKARALATGRLQVDFADLKPLAGPAMRHRLILNFDADADGVSADRILAEVLDSVSTKADI
ncbi:MAG: AAA family ATPase [Phycisphaerae bacterium]|nr:AAA family ATPase [Phycisphaerae bacterium]